MCTKLNVFDANVVKQGPKSDLVTSQKHFLLLSKLLIFPTRMNML